MSIINSVSSHEKLHLEIPTQEIKRVNSSSDEKVSAIGKDCISTLGRIFRVTLRLTLAVILLPAFLLKSIYDIALYVIKGKKSEQKIDENPKLKTERENEETIGIIEDSPLSTPVSTLVIKECEDDNSKDLVLDQSDKSDEMLSPFLMDTSSYKEREEQLKALLKPFVNRKEIKEELAQSTQTSFSLSDIFGYFKPLSFSTNKTSSERDLDKLIDKFSKMEVSESPDLDKKKVKKKQVRFEDEVQQTLSPLRSQILNSSICDAKYVDVVETKENKKQNKPQQKQPLRTSARVAEKKEKEKNFAPLAKIPSAIIKAPKDSQSEEKQPLRTSLRLEENKKKQGSHAAPVVSVSTRKETVKKDKQKEPEATPSLRRSARLAAKK